MVATSRSTRRRTFRFASPFTLILWPTIALLAVPRGARAQGEAAGLLSIDKLRTPTSPAFVLLGVSPAAIERPTTPAGFAATALNATENLAVLPKDFALEASPYWLFGRRGLTWQADEKRTFTEAFLRTAGLSVATAEKGTDARPVTGVALGFRASLASGVISEESKAQLERLQRALTEMSAELNRAIQEKKALLDSRLVAEIQESPTEVEKLTAAHESEVQKLLNQALTDRLEELDDDYGDLTVTREGFLLDIAGGAVWEVPRAALDSAEFTSWGAWVTAGYDLGPVSVLAVTRILGAVPDTALDRVDLGLRVNVETRTFVFGTEYVFRDFSGDAAPESEYRLAGIVEYRLRDQFWLTATFGKDHEDASGADLIAQFGLSFQFTRR